MTRASRASSWYSKKNAGLPSPSVARLSLEDPWLCVPALRQVCLFGTSNTLEQEYLMILRVGKAFTGIFYNYRSEATATLAK